MGSLRVCLPLVRCHLADTGITVLEVRWGERIMPWNITPHTSFSSWLNINHINTYYPTLEDNNPVPLTVIVEVCENRACAQGWSAGH